MKKALLVVTISTHVIEFLRLADALVADGQYEPIFCIAYTDSNYSTLPHPDGVSKFASLCLQKGHKVVNLHDLNTKNHLTKYIEDTISFPDFVKKKILVYVQQDDISDVDINSPKAKQAEPSSFKRFVRSYVPTPVRHFVNMIVRGWNSITFINNQVYQHFFYYQYYPNYIRHVLEKNEITIILLPEDNVSYGTSLWVKTGCDLGIPTAILPYTIANSEEAATVLSKYKIYDIDWKHPLNWIVSKIYPQWKLIYDNKALLRRTALDICLIEYFRVSTPNPWLFYSSHAQAILVESKAMLKYHMASGVSEEQLIITGASYDDTLAHYRANKVQYRNELYNELNLEPDKPLLLIALPPKISLDSINNVNDFRNFYEIADFWISSCKNLDEWNVVMSLHPSLSLDALSDIEMGNVRISSRSISQLIPISDIYIACVSATIRLAIACGIPIINYDVFRFRYSDYEEVDGVFTVEEKDEFRRVLNDLVTNRNSLNVARTAIEPHSKDWGNLDGKSTERITQTFDKLINEFN